MRIFIVGFMGCGKSYTGRRLAALVGVPFVDLDAFIVRRTGLSIPDIFGQHGEKYFRELERDTLEQLVDLPAYVIATGGGTPCYHDNMQLMRNHGLTVFLDASEQILLERLRRERDTRPLLENVADLAGFISAKLAERRPVYEQADYTHRQMSATADGASSILRYLPSPTVP